MTNGRLFGLGLGPGDPELVTLKALRLLRAAPVVAYPAPESGDSFARHIVAEWLDPGQREIAIRFPMRPGPPPATIYRTAAAQLAAVLGATLLLVLAAGLLRYQPSPGIAAAAVAALALCFVTPAALAVLPGLDRLWLSRAAAGLVAAHPPAAGMPLVAVGYSEPSLVFLLGADLRLATARGAAETLARGGEALVSSREDAMFRQALSARNLVPTPVGSAPGLDYSNGQRMVLTLYDVVPG